MEELAVLGLVWGRNSSIIIDYLFILDFFFLSHLQLPAEKC